MVDVVTTLTHDVLRTSSRNGSRSTAWNWKEITSRLPCCNTWGDWTLGLGKVELRPTLIEVVEGTIAIAGLKVGDSMLSAFGPINFRVSATEELTFGGNGVGIGRRTVVD